MTLARRRGEPPSPGTHGQQQRAERKRGGLGAPALVGKVTSLSHRCEGFPVAYCPHVVFSVPPGAGGDLRAQEVGPAHRCPVRHAHACIHACCRVRAHTLRKLFPWEGSPRLLQSLRDHLGLVGLCHWSHLKGDLNSTPSVFGKAQPLTVCPFTATALGIHSGLCSSNPAAPAHSSLIFPGAGEIACTPSPKSQPGKFCSAISVPDGLKQRHALPRARGVGRDLTCSSAERQRIHNHV